MVELAKVMPVCLVVRSVLTAEVLLDESPLPVVYAPRRADLESFVAGQALDVVFYVNQNVRNFQMLEYREPAHVHLSHGESDKVSMVSNRLMAYNHIFTAGAAARERITTNLVADHVAEKFIDVGRPQLDVEQEIPEGIDPQGRVVLYAPTWEGETPSMSYSSVASHGVELIRNLVGRGVNVIFRPHPRTGVYSPAAAQAVVTIKELLVRDNEQGGAHHIIDEGPDFGWQLNAAEFCVCDVSAVAYDWLATGKPFVLTKPTAPGAHLEPAGIVGKVPLITPEDVPRVASEIVSGDTEGSHEYRALAEHYFGDLTPGSAMQRWLAAAAFVASSRSETRIALAGQAHGDQDETPAVSIVIISYNVAGQLRAAIESALNQTLRDLEVIVVDDCSPDSSVGVALSYAASDPRLRVLRMPENSGGPGEPRNLGIDSARGRYVTFLDGDDVLDRHAAKNLLLAAEKDHSDVVLGQTIRFDVGARKRSGWYAALYAEPRSGFTLEDFPELIRDTNSTAKLYRREYLEDIGLRYEVGVHFEDLNFTARALSKAPALSLITEICYTWFVYPVDVRKSITANSDDVVNLDHRLVALEQVYKTFDEHGHAEISRQARLKFLKHDARIYLNRAIGADDGFLDDVNERLEPWFRAIPEDVYRELDNVERHIVAMSLMNNNIGLRQLMLYTQRWGTLAGTTVTRDGVTYWQPSGIAARAPEAGSLEARLLDVTDSPLASLPVSAARLNHELMSVESKRGWVRMYGRSEDPFGRIPDLAKIHGISLEVRLRGHKTHYSFPVTARKINDQEFEWEAHWQFPSNLTLIRPQVWTFFLVIGDAFGTSSAQIRNGMSEGFRKNVRPQSLVHKNLRRRYRFYETRLNNIALRLVRANGRRGSVDTILTQNLGAPRPTSPAATPAQRKVLSTAVYPAYRRLPVDPSLVLIESNLGRTTWDSPRYIAEEYRSRHPEVTILMAVDGDGGQLPDYIRPVRRWGREYMKALATAGILIENQSFPAFFRKRPEQTYLQTWHGIPLKTMGLDEPATRLKPKATPADIRHVSEQWDGLISPGPYFEETFVPAYDYRGPLVQWGSPRNDVLVTQAGDREAARHRLGIDTDRTIVLFAPTFRSESLGQSGRVARLDFDFAAWAESLGDSCLLLVRAHYLNRVTLPRALAGRVVDASSVENVNDLYLASDVLITDYSSVMFDYATLDRPIVLYTPDLESYVNSERGTYFDLRKNRPGPLVEDMPTLIETVASMAAAPEDFVGPEYQVFKDRYCGREDGAAAVRAVDFLEEERS